MYQYLFKVYYNILEEVGISIPNLQVDNCKFTDIIVLRKNSNLTSEQIELIKTKLTTWFKNKFSLNSIKVEFDNF